MQESLDALRQIPHVTSVEVLDEGNPDSIVDLVSVKRILNKKKKLRRLSLNLNRNRKKDWCLMKRKIPLTMNLRVYLK